MAITVTSVNNTMYPNSRRYAFTIPNTKTIYTVVTSDDADTNSWIRVVRTYGHFFLQKSKFIVGITVQFKEASYRMAATLQLITGTNCLIYKLCHSTTTPALLVEFLLDPNITFVSLCNITRSRLALSRHQLKMLPNMPLNLRNHVRGNNQRSLENDTVDKIAREVLGMNFINETDFGCSSSDWESLELNLDQIKHATLDVFVPFKLGMRFNAWAFNPNLNHGAGN